MYISNLIKPRANQPSKPARTLAQRAANNAHIATLVVRASSGFSIKGIHKFHFFKRQGRIVPQYCDTCSKARRIINIDGEHVDYVDITLRYFAKGWDCETYVDKEAKIDFENYIKNKYKQIVNQ